MLSARLRSRRPIARASRSRGPPRVTTDVVGYSVYLNGVRVGTQTPDQVRRWRDRDTLSYTLRAAHLRHGLHGRCGRVRSQRPALAATSRPRSPPRHAPTQQPPRRRRGMRQTAATENSVVLAWTPSTDNVGVVEYGLYASGMRVTTVTDASATLTGLELRQELSDRPRRGRRRRQPLGADQRVLQDLRLPLDQQATHHTHRRQGHRGHRHDRRPLVDRLHRRRRRDRLRALPVRLANQRDNRHDAGNSRGSSAAPRTRSESTPRTPQACARRLRPSPPRPRPAHLTATSDGLRSRRRSRMVRR